MSCDSRGRGSVSCRFTQVLSERIITFMFYWMSLGTQHQVRYKHEGYLRNLHHDFCMQPERISLAIFHRSSLTILLDILIRSATVLSPRSAELEQEAQHRS